MSDDKTRRGEPDSSRVSGEEPYELQYFANKHGITTEQAKDLIQKHGNDRAALDEAAARLRSN
ncbi:DUF3606 domain-containing protein [Phenylobacterium sp. LjRoot164]|uniref:DUF3606 domain-containing protein n=1 Tax=unclassified Phenylobacterium TaxID=2640670 RepID=UPI003ED02D8E